MPIEFPTGGPGAIIETMIEQRWGDALLRLPRNTARTIEEARASFEAGDFFRIFYPSLQDIVGGVLVDDGTTHGWRCLLLQRNQILARDMDRETFKAGTHDCVVLTGSLRDSYTGTTISFTRGQGTSEKVQIDHVVALSDAWQKGAQQLDAATREKIGNDPLNLIAVDGPTNGRKSDGDAATWLPPDSRYRCAYVARQVAVKKKYKLWVTGAERDAIDRVLGTCPTRAVTSEADAAKPAITLR